MRAKTYASKVQVTSKVQVRCKVKKQQGMYRRVCVGGGGVGCEEESCDRLDRRNG